MTAVTLKTTEQEERLAGKINPGTMQAIALSQSTGGIAFASITEVMEFSKLMSVSGIAIREHLRGNPGACVAVTMQALHWGMDPFQVASKSYEVNKQMAWEAQLIAAVILKRAPIKGRIKYEYNGEGADLRVRIWAELRDEPGEIVDYDSPRLGDIRPQNSPLWKNDPAQQLGYFGARAWCRRHFPDVLLGAYSADEMVDSDEYRGPDRARDVTPSPSLASRLDNLAGVKPTEQVDEKTGEVTDKAKLEAEKAQPKPRGRPPKAAEKAQDAREAQPATVAAPEAEKAAVEQEMQEDEANEGEEDAPFDADQDEAQEEEESEPENPIFAAGREAASNGFMAFKKWKNRLTVPQIDAVKVMLPSLEKMAKDADAGNGG